MSESVTQTLAKKLSLPVPEVERQVERSVQSLLDELVDNGRFDIGGFGQFFREDDELIFSPSSELAAAVNFRYRSLEPQIVQSSPELAISDEEMEESLVGADLPLETHDTVGTIEGQPESSVEEPAKEEILSDRSPERPSGSPDGTYQPRVFRHVYWLLPVLIVGTILVVFLRPDSSQTPTILGTPEPGSEVTDPPVDETAALEGQSIPPLQDETLQAENASTQIDAETAQNESAAQQNTNAASVPTGFSSSFDRTASGYTLIVGSVFSLSDAESEMERYVNLTFPMAILDYEDGDITRYRLAIGQFETIELAQQAIAASAEQLPDGTWVRRIR